MSRLSFSVAGDGYQVHCDDDAITAQLAQWVAPFTCPVQRPLELALRCSPPRLEVNGGPTRPLESREDLMPALEGLIYERLSRHTVLHAAVAVFRRRAALFLGDSGAGKSVLSLELEARGWTYVSDEFAPIDAELQVIAVPRPVCFDQSELEPQLWSRLAHGRTTFSNTIRTRSGEPLTSLYALPARRAVSGQRFEVGAIFRLTPRPRQRPLLTRVPHPEMRALLFALTARRAGF